VRPDAFSVPEPPVTPLAWHGSWRDGHLRLLDQTRLPRHETWVTHHDAAGVITDIRRLAVRGAPAIGIAGAYALALAARTLLAKVPSLGREAFLEPLGTAACRIANARPTAVNLPAAVSRHLVRVRANPAADTPEAICAALLEDAHALWTYEREACASMGRYGAAWLHGSTRFLTHCNAGALATSGIGTALAPLYVLHASGVPIHVTADESRPLLQGLRLTAYELAKAGIPYVVEVDSAAAGLLRSGAIDAVITGADRICANGDVVNKVGTYAVALAAHAAGVPFVVAAPLSTLDAETASGADVAIEDRPADAAAYLLPDTAPDDLAAFAPAFDVTPAHLVTALVSERGVLEQPDNIRIQPWLSASRALQDGVEGGR